MKTQVVSGLNYDVTVDAGSETVKLRIYKPISGESKLTECTGGQPQAIGGDPRTWGPGNQPQTVGGDPRTWGPGNQPQSVGGDPRTWGPGNQPQSVGGDPRTWGPGNQPQSVGGDPRTWGPGNQPQTVGGDPATWGPGSQGQETFRGHPIVGGFGQAKQPDEECIRLVQKHRADAERQLGRTFSKWEAVSMKTQVVAGLNYDVTVDAGSEFVRVKINRPISGETKLLQVTGGVSRQD